MKLSKAILFVFCFLCGGLGWSSLQAQNESKPPKQKTFDINSSTLILDEHGNAVDFRAFIQLKPETDYTGLKPEFDDEGNLRFIRIDLLREIDLQALAEKPLPKPAPAASGSGTANNGASSSTQKRFRFTTASELQDLNAPYFKEKDNNGKEYSSTTLAGKVVVVKFWFLKCAPCLEEIPELNHLVDAYKNESDVVFLAPATDKLDAVRRFLKRRTFKYKVLPDAFDFHADFKVAGYPTHLVIDRKGNVSKVFTGKNSNIKRYLSKAIDKALLTRDTDLYVQEIAPPSYVTGMVIRDVDGALLDYETYREKVSSNKYLYYKRVKMDGSEEILLKNKNK